MKHKAGIVGCGGIAHQKHFPALSNASDRVEIVACCDIIVERAQEAAREFGAPGCKNLLNRMIQEIQFLSSNAVVGQSADISTIPSTTVRMAIAVIGVLPIAVVYPFIQKNFAKGITLGAVKG